MVAGYLATRAELRQQSSSVSDLTGSIQQWLVGARVEMVATAETPLYVGLDDPVFIAMGEDRFVQAGYVSSVDGTRGRDPIEVSQADVVVYDWAIEQFPDGFKLEYYTTPMNLDWAIRMLIPAERQEEINRLLRHEWELHQEDVMVQMQPVIRESVRRAIDAVEAELPRIVDSHRDEFRNLGYRFEEEILREELMPLVRDEIFPVVQEEARPLAMDIGQALWKRVSLFSFTWRYLYDVSPLPERNALRNEFQRFIDQEAVPELQSRTDEFMEVTRAVVQRVMENDRVRDTISESAQRVMDDPELREIVGRIVREATVDNVSLRHELREYWRSHDTQLAVRVASNRFEKVVRTIGDLIFGTREKGITPEFSRILRSQVLKKDRRWFVISPDDSVDPRTVRVTVAEEPMLYPLKFEGQQQSPLTPESSPVQVVPPAD